MALQTTGAISLDNIQTEFGGTTPIAISEYTKAPNGLVPNTATNTAVDAGPTVEGTSPGVGGSVMAFSDYYGAAKDLTVTSATLSPSSRAEGQSFTLTVNTANAANGTVLYWTMVGTGTYPATGADVGSDTGTITINSNTGSTTITTSDNIESTASPNVQFYVQIRKDSLSGTILGTSNTATITEVWDSIALLGHSIFTTTAGTSGTATSTFGLTATGIARGTSAYTSTIGTSTIDGSAASTVDFPGQWYVSGQDKTQYSARGTWSGTDGTTTGPASGAWVTVGSVNRNWALTTTGTNASRNLVVDIAPTSDLTNILASNTIQFQANSAAYAVTISSTSPTTVLETGSFNVVIATNLAVVPNGSTLYWTLLGTGTSPAVAADLNQGGSGSFTTTGTSTTLSFTAAANADSPFAAAKTLQIQIRSGSTTGTVLATSSTVTINDNSTAVNVSGVTNIVNDRTGLQDNSVIAGITLRSDGLIYTNGANTATTNGVALGSWITGTFTAADYSVRFISQQVYYNQTGVGVSKVPTLSGYYVTVSSVPYYQTTGYPTYVELGTMASNKDFGIQVSKTTSSTDWSAAAKYSFTIQIYQTAQPGNSQTFTFTAEAITDYVAGPLN